MNVDPKWLKSRGLLDRDMMTEIELDWIQLIEEKRPIYLIKGFLGGFVAAAFVLAFFVGIAGMALGILTDSPEVAIYSPIVISVGVGVYAAVQSHKDWRRRLDEAKATVWKLTEQRRAQAVIASSQSKAKKPREKPTSPR